MQCSRFSMIPIKVWVKSKRGLGTVILQLIIFFFAFTDCRKAFESLHRHLLNLGQKLVNNNINGKLFFKSCVL